MKVSVAINSKEGAVEVDGQWHIFPLIDTKEHLVLPNGSIFGSFSDGMMVFDIAAAKSFLFDLPKDPPPAEGEIA